MDNGRQWTRAYSFMIAFNNAAIMFRYEILMSKKTDSIRELTALQWMSLLIFR